MSRKTRHIENLTAEDKEVLREGYKNGEAHHFRKRCHCILLSYEGRTVPELKELFEVRNNTIYEWFDRWEDEGIAGLQIRSGRGRKRKLNFENEYHVEQMQKSLSKENRNLNQLKEDLESKLGYPISKVSLRRFLKKLVTDTSDLENA